jgi:hypothetical protein
MYGQGGSQVRWHVEKDARNAAFKAVIEANANPQNSVEETTKTASSQQGSAVSKEAGVGDGETMC